MATKKGTGAKKQAAPLDPKVADRLLDLLSTDNEFRRLFKKDPQAALVKAGWKPPKETAASGVTKARKGPPFTPPGPPEAVPPVDCLKVRRIAPKAQIIAARDNFKRELMQGLGYSPNHFEAVTTSSPRSRK
jgi:putative modified peptide